MSGTGPHQFEMDAWISCAPFEKLLNMRIEKAAEGEAVLSMPFAKELAQGAGLMHGGALVSLADTAVVMAIKSVVPPGTYFATISLETRFHYPVKRGVVTARARVEKVEGRILFGEAILYDDANRKILQFSSRFKIARDARIDGITFKQDAVD